VLVGTPRPRHSDDTKRAPPDVTRPQSKSRNRWFEHGAAEPTPVPLDTFLFKVASRCNLACPYCYVYELRDQGWRSQPTFMSARTHELALDRIRDHILSHSVPLVTSIFHGGEPLLIGPQALHEMASRTRDRLGDVAEIRLGLQTNGTLFDERFLEVAFRHKMRVGLSLDGPPRHQDRLRFQPNGAGSSERVENAAALLRDNPDVFGGILCVVNLDIDPSELWDYLCGFRPKSIDLLLPLATHDHPPAGAGSPADVSRYGRWLVRFLELWYRAGEHRPDVRYFSSIMRLLLGRASLVESIGIGLSTLIVIESNGDLEAVDSLKACYHGAASTGLNVTANSFDEALKAPAIMSRQMGPSSLCAACRGCAFLRVCGGGYQPHRYSEARGFQNPSIYCEAIQMLVGRIAELMRGELELAAVPVPSLLETLADGRSDQARV
jgi:uncharacterized protein